MDADHRFAGWEFASPPSVPSSESVRGRFGYVDGLRGLAIVAVVLYELRHHGIVVASGSLGRLFEEGSRGVDLFFVISGFALALPVLTVLRTEGRAGLDLPRYAVRRLVRIVPAAWVAIAALVLAPAVVSALHHSTLHAVLGALRPPGAILRQLLFLERPRAAPDAFWVVAVALRWYLVFPALLLLWTRRRRAFLGLGAAVVLLDPWTRLHGFGLGELPACMLGIVAADWRVRQAGFARWGLFLAVACGIAGFALETILHGPLFASAPFPADNLGWQAAAFFLLAGAGSLERGRQILEPAALVATGSASFAVALVVEGVAGSMRPVLHALHGSTIRISSAFMPGRPVADALDLLVTGLAVSAAGFALYRGVDRAVTERGPRLRIADRARPFFRSIRAFTRTSGVLVLGRATGEPRYASGTLPAGASYAPPPRGDDGDLTAGRPPSASIDADEALIAAKRRLGEGSAALLADAEYEANRARGAQATPVPFPYDVVPPGLVLPEASASSSGGARDIWMKPRAAAEAPAGAEQRPSTSPPPAPKVVDAETPVAPFRLMPKPEVRPAGAAIRFKVGGTPGLRSGNAEGESGDRDV